MAGLTLVVVIIIATLPVIVRTNRPVRGQSAQEQSG
jgi:hypothetical protein